MSTSPIDLSSTALVFIDLQRGLVNLPLLPRSGEEVVHRAARLASRFRGAQAAVILVNVAFSNDGRDAWQPEEGHFFSLRQILPRIGLVRSVEEVLSACTDSGVHQPVI